MSIHVPIFGSLELLFLLNFNSPFPNDERMPCFFLIDGLAGGDFLLRARKLGVTGLLTA